MEEAHGYYNVTPGPAGQKLLGQRDTRREPVTTAHWERHLGGDEGLGIIPINKDNKCRWGCIDIDKYDCDHKTVIARIKQHKLPLVVCRSKSGGAHVFLFMREPVPAADLQAKLRLVAAAMGYGNCEIFPKQTQVLADRGDIGSWLNLPYFDADNTTRYAFNDKGDSLNLTEFLDLAEAKALTPDALAVLQPLAPADEFSGGPPCLQNLVSQGFPEGTRNNGLTALATFAKKKYPDDWRVRVEKYNQDYLQPPLSSDEVATIIKSADRKDYNYRCKDLPIAAFCNAGVCRSRQYGVGAGGALPSFGALTKLNTNPPTWFLDVEGGRLELETDDLQSQVRFQKKCMDVLNVMPPRMKEGDWQQLIQHLLEAVVVIEAAPEASAEGFFTELLEAFTSSDRSMARNREEILLGKPWLDADNGTVYFRLIDLMNYLTRNKFKDLTRHQIASKLRKLGAEHEVAKIKGQALRLYFMRVSEEAREPFATPKIPGGVF